MRLALKSGESRPVVWRPLSLSQVVAQEASALDQTETSGSAILGLAESGVSRPQVSRLFSRWLAQVPNSSALGQTGTCGCRMTIRGSGVLQQAARVHSSRLAQVLEATHIG